MSARPNPEQAFASALQGRGFGPGGKGATVVSHPAKPVLPALRDGDIDLGRCDAGGLIGIGLQQLLEGRLLIQGISGAGKSWTLRRLIEQTWGQVQQIIIDPEGEYRELAAKLDILHVEGHRLDIATLADLATRARAIRASFVLDLSELERDDQMAAVTAVCGALIAAPREHWHPVLVFVDEAHLFAPWGGYSEATAIRKASIATMTDLMSRGRKRGLAGVLATQRLVRLARSVVAEAQNYMVGLNTLDLDIRRAAETIGWDARKAFDRLPLLSPGEFVVVGSGFSRSPAVMKVGPVETRHRGGTPQLTPPTSIAPRKAAELMDLEKLLQASADDREMLDERAAAPGLRIIRGFIRDPAFPDAGRVWGALRKLAPEGARVRDLAGHLNRSEDEVTAALALLDMYGVLEFRGDGADRAARLAKGMAS